jgi:hypothetical protein
MGGYGRAGIGKEGQRGREGDITRLAVYLCWLVCGHKPVCRDGQMGKQSSA